MPLNGNSRSALQKQVRSPSTVTCAKDYFLELSELVLRIPHQQVDAIAEVLLRAHTASQKVFLFGNGGSASLASHFACDLGKGATAFGDHKKHFRAIALTDNIPMLTAWANDSSYDEIFSRQLRNFVEAGDVAFAISGSGNSTNVLMALEYARKAGAYCVGLTGYQGGKMKRLCDVCLVVPSDNMQMIEDVHLSVAHSLFTIVRRRLELSQLENGVKSAVAAH